MVDCTALERRHVRLGHRGFESLSFRHEHKPVVLDLRAFLYLRPEKPYSSGILILRALDRSCATLFFLGRICTRSGLKLRPLLEGESMNKLTQNDVRRLTDGDHNFGDGLILRAKGASRT